MTCRSAVQEIRFSSYNLGILRSNDVQEVLVRESVIGIVPKDPNQVSIPSYDGAELLAAIDQGESMAVAAAQQAAPAGAEAAPPAANVAEEAAPPPAAAQAPAPTYAAAPVTPPAYAPTVAYSEPQSSFWTNAAIFTGGAVIGGLLGYAIGGDDDDDDDHGNYYGWGGGGGRYYSDNDIKINGDVTINRPCERSARAEQPGAAWDAASALRRGSAPVDACSRSRWRARQVRPAQARGRTRSPGVLPQPSVQLPKPVGKPSGVAAQRPSLPKPVARPSPSTGKQTARRDTSSGALGDRPSPTRVAKESDRGARSRQSAARPAAATASAGGEPAGAEATQAGERGRNVATEGGRRRLRQGAREPRQAEPGQEALKRPERGAHAARRTKHGDPGAKHGPRELAQGTRRRRRIVDRGRYGRLGGGAFVSVGRGRRGRLPCRAREGRRWQQPAPAVRQRAPRGDPGRRPGGGTPGDSRAARGREGGAPARAAGGRRQALLIGAQAWPLPFPLVESGESWHFDVEAGLDEIINRRIGRNELAAIDLCRAYAEAQVEYASVDRDGDDVLEYATRVGSTPGKHDGLYWVDESGDDPSPLGDFAAAAEDYLEFRKQGEPYYGYRFRVLTAQGSAAPGGRYSYVINGNMIAGFALVAWPVEPGNSGIMTFIVSQTGRIYQKDLGTRRSRSWARSRNTIPARAGAK